MDLSCQQLQVRAKIFDKSWIVFFIIFNFKSLNNVPTIYFVPHTRNIKSDADQDKMRVHHIIGLFQNVDGNDRMNYMIACFRK